MKEWYKYMTHKKIFQWVYIAKGIGIIFVVWGHFFPYNSPKYWIFIKKLIYTFHMPLFFMLSGFLYVPEKYTYLQLIKNKIRRLGYPYLSIALIFLFIKFCIEMFFELQFPVNIKSITFLFIDPVNSYVPLLWFIYALFFIFLIYPIMYYSLFKSNLIVLLAVIIINLKFLKYIPPGIAKSFVNMSFFIVGRMIRDRLSFIEKYNKNMYNLIFIFVFLILFLTAFYFKDLYPQIKYIFNLILGVSGSLLIVNLSILLENRLSFLGNILSSVGFYSMGIYLLHTLFVSSIRLIYYQKVGLYLNLPFILIALVAITFGVLLPLILEKYVLRKYPFSRKYILGIQ